MTEYKDLWAFLKENVPPSEYVLSVFYPRRCIVCGKAVSMGRYIHRECMERLPFVDNCCRRCGRPLAEGDGSGLCGICREQLHFYDMGRAVFVYDEVMRKALSGLKYEHKKEYGQTFGRLMVFRGRKYFDIWRPDVIIPVPVHRERLKKRGYNQTEVMGREISRLTGIPLETGALARKKKTTALKDLSPAERRRELEEAFCPGKPDLEDRQRLNGKQFFNGMKVLVIDDIFTTGATMDACSRVLKEQGAGAVYFLAAAAVADKHML